MHNTVNTGQCSVERVERCQVINVVEIQLIAIFLMLVHQFLRLRLRSHHSPDFEALLQKTCHDMSANEACRACNEDISAG